MKMPNNPAKYEVLIKQYLRSILDISGIFLALTKDATILDLVLRCSFKTLSILGYFHDQYSISELLCAKRSVRAKPSNVKCVPATLHFQAKHTYFHMKVLKQRLKVT